MSVCGLCLIIASSKYLQSWNLVCLFVKLCSWVWSMFWVSESVGSCHCHLNVTKYVTFYSQHKTTRWHTVYEHTCTLVVQQWQMSHTWHDLPLETIAAANPMSETQYLSTVTNTTFVTHSLTQLYNAFSYTLRHYKHFICAYQPPNMLKSTRQSMHPNPNPRRVSPMSPNYTTNDIPFNYVLGACGTIQESRLATK